MSCKQNQAKYQPAGHQHPVYGGTFVYADEADIRTLDTAIGYDTVSWVAAHLVFNGLLDYDDDVQLIGSLASSWEVSEDGLRWTFRLRQDVYFHDWTRSDGVLVAGRQMVADDVIYSWSRLFEPGLGSPATDFFDVIKGSEAVLNGDTDTISGLTAPDPYTLIVDLKEADATFGNSVAMVFGSVILKEAVEDRGDRWGYAPVGTGPFSVSEWKPGVSTVFVAHDKYWQEGLPYLDRVVHLANYPRSVQFLKLEAGELHQVDRLSSPDYLWIKRDSFWSDYLSELPSVDTYAEMMNTQMPPFDNVWFRRAVSTAIDRDKIRRLRNNRAKPTISWIPPGLTGHMRWEDLSEADQSAFVYQRFDRELSLQCLQKAGYPDGYPHTIDYMTLTDEASLTTAQSIQQDLAQVGIHLELRNTTFPAYLASTGKRGEVQMAYSAWVMDYPDAKNFLQTKFHCDSISDENSVNDSFYCNQEVDRLLDEGAREVDEHRRAALYDQAHRIIAHEAPYAFEYHSMSVSVGQPWVRGFRNHPVWIRDMSRVWMDLSESDRIDGAVW